MNKSIEETKKVLNSSLGENELAITECEENLDNLVHEEKMLTKEINDLTALLKTHRGHLAEARAEEKDCKKKKSLLEKERKTLLGAKKIIEKDYPEETNEALTEEEIEMFCGKDIVEDGDIGKVSLPYPEEEDTEEDLELKVNTEYEPTDEIVEEL